MRRHAVLEPKVREDLPPIPEVVGNAADKSKCCGTRTGRALCNNFLDESLVLVRLAVVQRWVFGNLPRGEPDEDLGTDEPAGEIEVNFVREPVGENIVEVLGNVRGGEVVVVGVAV